MKHGNISNHQAPFVMFCIDDYLYTEPEKKFMDKITGYFKTDKQKYLEQPLNLSFVSYLDTVFKKHNLCIGLFTFKEMDEDFQIDIEMRLGDAFVTYTRLFVFQEWEDLRHFPYKLYTVTDNQELISYLSDSGAMTLERFREVL